MKSEAADFSTLSAFQADDESIVVVPAFDLPQQSSMPLFSSSSSSSKKQSRLGPFRAGISVSVPLWLGIMLQERSLATLSMPDWMNRDNLIDIVQYERQNELLFHDPQRLPHRYYELTRRLSPYNTSDPSIRLLVEDLLQLRLDKLRQQFQVLLSRETSSSDRGGTLGATDLLVSVTGIASQELAVMGSFVTQALDDVQSLRQQPKSNADPLSSAPSATASSTTAQSSAPPPPAAALRSRLPLRRFRN